ncbi:MAG: hypothetical protein JJU05_05835 [Verrucomicrobia bacterium]|nr:hypothetical protein [Verrucomicrobiota bacterium]MCH8525660.1 hypothetical protein [Kiritimatiellia bacterium]
MAYRIHDSVVSGELDFRVKGRVTGYLDLFGCDVPVHLDLRGFPNPDLAGVILRFKNPEANQPLPYGMHPIQEGTTGDLTASRKNRILDCSVEEAMALAKQKLPFPEHWGNTLYLEWFSSYNGRVVVEIGDAEVHVEGMPTWRMTEEDQCRQQEEMFDAFGNFMNSLQDAIDEEDPEGFGEE